MKSKSESKNEMRNACRAALEQVTHFAEKGADLAMEAALEEMRVLSKEAGIRLSEKLIQEIRQTGYENAYQVALNETKQFAEVGNIAMLKVSIDNLREFAKKSGVAVEENLIQEAKISAYKNAYKLALREAIQFAQMSKEAILDSATLKNVKRYVQKPANAFQETVFEVIKGFLSSSKIS